MFVIDLEENFKFIGKQRTSVVDTVELEKCFRFGFFGSMKLWLHREKRSSSSKREVICEHFSLLICVGKYYYFSGLRLFCM